MGDTDVRTALSTNGALRGELEEELRALDGELPDLKADASTAVELRDDSLIDEMIVRVDGVNTRVEALEMRLKALKPGAVAATAVKLAPADSPIWQGLARYRGQTRTNGAGGGGRQYYEWDFTHGDIEVYDGRGNHLGSMDPVSGEMTKPPVAGRTIEI
jgi:hypothetical protein